MQPSRLVTALAFLLLPLAAPASAQMMNHDAAPPGVSVKGFGDVGFVKTPDSPGSFTRGQLDAFVTATPSEHVAVLIEAVAEAGHSNTTSVDVERALVRYTVSDRFRVAVGRYHTTLGFYNTAYHHGAWFQTAVGRPEMFAFEDDGGILPMHEVGLQFDGKVPAGNLGLRWFVEVGNGHAPAGQEAVQITRDADNRKCINVALWSQPDRIPGLTIGASYFRDRFQYTPETVVSEDIATAQAGILRGHVEWLNELVRVTHRAGGGAAAVSYAGYSQVARQLGPVKPYVRLEGFRAPAGAVDPIIERTESRTSLLVGVRRELAPTTSLKVEITSRKEGIGAWTHGAAAQVAFAF